MPRLPPRRRGWHALAYADSDCTVRRDADLTTADLHRLLCSTRRSTVAGRLLRERVKCKQPQTVILKEDDCRLRGCPDHA